MIAIPRKKIASAAEPHQRIKQQPLRGRPRHPSTCSLANSRTSSGCSATATAPAASSSLGFVIAPTRSDRASRRRSPPSPCRSWCRRRRCVVSGAAPASAIACSTIDGCGLDGWRSAVWSDTKRAWMPCCSRQCLRPRSDLPVATASSQPSCLERVEQLDHALEQRLLDLARRAQASRTRACNPRQARVCSAGASGSSAAIASSG